MKLRKNPATKVQIVFGWRSGKPQACRPKNIKSSGASRRGRTKNAAGKTAETNHRPRRRPAPSRRPRRSSGVKSAAAMSTEFGRMIRLFRIVLLVSTAIGYVILAISAFDSHLQDWIPIVTAFPGAGLTVKGTVTLRTAPRSRRRALSIAI